MLKTLLKQKKHWKKFRVPTQGFFMSRQEFRSARLSIFFAEFYFSDCSMEDRISVFTLCFLGLAPR